MASTNWNWAWVDSQENTDKASESILASGGTVYTFRQARNGRIDSSDLNAAFESTASNIHAMWGNWLTHTRPLLDSLPAGGRDQRWSTINNKGLPAKIDALTYGIQGTTLFVFNDATSTKADGRYWHTDDDRPKTIAETLEDIHNRISTLSVSSTAGSSVSDQELEDIWAAVGHRYKDPLLTSLATSLDIRTGTLESYMNQLNEDIYGVSIYGGGLGTQLNYSVAYNIDKLLELHGSNWQDNPDINHDAIDIPIHGHLYSEITNGGFSSETYWPRVGTVASLEEELGRLRWEMRVTRGATSWQTDITSPWGPTITSLKTHIDFAGSGTQDADNPHGINYTDTGANTVFANVFTFTGMDSISDTTPTYISTDYVVNGEDLELSVGRLDAAISSFVGSGTVIRADYDYDRSLLSETEREATPITVVHNVGRKPIIEVFDVSPSEMTYFGEYASPAVDLNIVHIDNNSFEIWTGAAVIEVITMY